jgi:hypothetical protein
MAQNSLGAPRYDKSTPEADSCTARSCRRHAALHPRRRCSPSRPGRRGLGRHRSSGASRERSRSSLGSQQEGRPVAGTTLEGQLKYRLPRVIYDNLPAIGTIVSPNNF